MLLDHVFRQLIDKRDNYNFECLLYVSDKYQPKLIPSPSPLKSFLYHPEVHKAAQNPDFSVWQQNSVYRFYQLKSGSGLASFQQNSKR